MQNGYAQQPTSQQPGYAPQAGSGLGGRILGGVATGLALGAGMMAAEALARNMMGHQNPVNSAAGLPSGDSRGLGGFGSNDFQASNTNQDMGGTNFGVEDTGLWDGTGSGDGSSSDWDT